MTDTKRVVILTMMFVGVVVFCLATATPTQSLLSLIIQIVGGVVSILIYDWYRGANEPHVADCGCSPSNIGENVETKNPHVEDKSEDDEV